MLKCPNLVSMLCSENPCDQLPAPENGAMSCDTWLLGLQCQMQCSDNYDIPLGTVGSDGSPFTGLFTCSEFKGEYGPSNTVPGCTRTAFLYLSKNIFNGKN